MILEEHETIVRKIVDESNHEPKKAGKKPSPYGMACEAGEGTPTFAASRD